MSSQQRACIFANGVIDDPTFIQSHLKPDDLLIAADGGNEHLAALGLCPHVLIGDLDSTQEQELLRFADQNTVVLRYPTAKNETDLELAIQYALNQNASEILIFGALGGRWDMSLANIFLLTYPYLYSKTRKPTKITIIEPNQEFTLITENLPLCLIGKANDPVSLIPLSPTVEGIQTQNLLYPLHKETLFFGTTRGVSNVMLSEKAFVQIQHGLLLCVHTLLTKVEP